MHATLPLLNQSDFPALRRGVLDTLQVNLGYLCNQQCLHCHVNAGPNRKELMSREVIDEVLRFIDRTRIRTLDLTGGAPELNPEFRYLVTEARARDVHVIDRCNLTVLNEPGQEGLAEFLAEQQVEVVASLPCYLEENVDGQRGKGVFEGSMKGIQMLNAQGYGLEGTGLMLNLVYNPVGPYLPPAQHQLESDYKRELKERFGLLFNKLLTITNMPIKRFGSTLISKGQFHSYMDLLRSSYRADNLETVMCRNLLSVDWQGYLFDCDFNQMLDLPLADTGNGVGRVHIHNLDLKELEGKAIVVADHCYGCTAGQGSSCSGALS